jgi:hypothetical protein
MRGRSRVRAGGGFAQPVQLLSPTPTPTPTPTPEPANESTETPTPEPSAIAETLGGLLGGGDDDTGGD